jgi:hypothetical protein
MNIRAKEYKVYQDAIDAADAPTIIIESMLCVDGSMIEIFDVSVNMESEIIHSGALGYESSSVRGKSTITGIFKCKTSIAVDLFRSTDKGPYTIKIISRNNNICVSTTEIYDVYLMGNSTSSYEDFWRMNFNASSMLQI